MNPKAFIFDFDGVLVDLEPVHCKVWQKVLKSFGIFFSDREYQKKYLGLSDRDFLKKIFRERKRPLAPTKIRELIALKEKKSKKTFKEGVPLIDGAEAFLKKAHAKGPLALVTGGLKSEVYFVLRQLKWRKFFSIVITSTDVQKGKPSPEGFLKAFRKLCVLRKWAPPLKKSDCLIFEDSAYGIRAAKRASIPHVVVRKSLSPYFRFT